MPRIQLTDITIRNLKTPPRGQVTYFDANLSGFSVRVSQGGTKTFTVVYGPTRSRLTLGRVGVLSLADARKEAKRVLAEHTLGKTRPKTVVFEDAKETFLAECEGSVKPFTVYEYKRHLDTHFKFGRTPLEDITQEQIVARLKKLNSKPSEKRHAFVTFRRFIRWCKARQNIRDNPMDGLICPPNASRKRVLTLPELRAVLNHALSFGGNYGAIVALLILTGQRKSEIASLERSWVSRGIVTLPETKNGQEHSFPLCKLAREVLAGVPQTSETYFFPVRETVEGKAKKSPYFNGWSKAKKAFDEGLEGVEHYTLHDLRRTLSTNFAEMGIPIAVTEKLLNHVSGTHSGVQGTYNRYAYMKEMTAAVEKYERLLLKKSR